MEHRFLPGCHVARLNIKTSSGQVIKGIYLHFWGDSKARAVQFGNTLSCFGAKRWMRRWTPLCICPVNTKLGARSWLV